MKHFPNTEKSKWMIGFAGSHRPDGNPYFNQEEAKQFSAATIDR